MRKLTTVLLALGACAVAFGATGVTPEQVKTDLEKNKPEAFRIEKANNLWKAVGIGVDAPKNYGQEDYARTEYGQPWDFSLGMPDKLKGKLNVKNFRLEDGALKFTTGEDAEIFWGDHYQKNPEFGEESIGKSWGGHWHPMWLRLKIKQSLPESTWELQMRHGNSLYQWRDRKPFTLKGTQWQTVRMPLGDSRGWFASLSLLCAQPGNDVEIEALSVYTPKLTRAFQKTFTIDSEVAKAAFCVQTAPDFKVFVNGQLACQAEGSSRMGGVLYRYDDMGKWFHKGGNTIRVEAETCNWSGDVDGMILEGMVSDRDGKIYPLQTDASWLAQYLPASGKVDKTAWKTAKLLGKPQIGYYIDPPNYGRVQAKPAGRALPIFRPGEDVAFDVEALGKGLTGAFDLDYTVTDALDSDKPVVSGNLLKGNVPALAKAELSFTPPHAGVYNVALSLRSAASGEELDSNVLEAAVVGKIEQPEILGTSANEGLKLKLVDSATCADLASRPLACASWGSEELAPVVTEKPFGKYLESGDKTWDFLSWKLDFPDYRRPFLLELDYPDDANRIIGVSLGFNAYYGCCNDPGGRDWPFGVSGTYTGFQHPVTNKMRTLRMVFYPKAPLGTLTVMNALNGSRAAVAGFRLYAVENELPALKFATAPSRLTGIHAERITEIPNSFYNGDMQNWFSDGQQLCLYPFHGFYREWYRTNVNLIKYMRFCGENALIAGLKMYNDTLYPSSDPDDLRSNGSGQADAAALMGEMFAANKLSLLLGLEYSAPMLVRQSNRVTDAAVAAGAPTKCEVDKNGKQVKTWHDIANINEPDVQDGFFRMINDLCGLYKDNPGVKGLYVQEVAGAFHPCLAANTMESPDPLFFGYSDTSVATFEKETGVKVPVALDDPKRFGKRHDWLTSKGYDQWVSWRCAKIHALNAKMLELAQDANPAWTVFLMNAFPADSLFKQKLTYQDFQRRTGFDPQLHREDGFCVGRNYGESIRHQSGEPASYLDGQAFTSAPEVVELFNDGLKRTCVQTGPQFYEPSLRMKPGSWYWDTQLNGSYCLPPDDNLNRMYERVLYHETPYMVAQCWTDMNTLNGAEQWRRLFNRAFTVIPEGDYRNLEGNGLDANTVIRAAGANFYAINLLPVELKLTLSAVNAKAVRDLGTGETYRFADGSCEVTLPANGMRTFALQGGGLFSSPRLTGAASLCPEELAAPLRGRVGEVVALAQALDSPEPMAKRFVKLADGLAADLKGEKYGKLLMTFDSGDFLKAFAEVKDLASPVNWLVLGPLPNVGRKAFDEVLPVEKDLLAGIMEKSYSGLDWRKVVGQSGGDFRGIVDLKALYGGGGHDYQLSYAVTQVYVPAETPVALRLGSDDGLKVWINGKQVFSVKPEGRGLVPAEDKATGVLKQGWNQVVLKIDNNVGGWGFSCEFKGLDGKDVPGLKYAFNR